MLCILRAGVAPSSEAAAVAARGSTVPRDEYQLIAGEAAVASDGGISADPQTLRTSRRVRLNGGAPLTVDSELLPRHIGTAGAMTTDCGSGAVSHSVVLAAHSYGFMLLKNASAPGCFTYE